MINPSNVKEIVFPHFIPTPIFRGKRYEWNDVDGGAELTEKKGFPKNKCLGGRCMRMGLVKSLGLWACQDKYDTINHKRVFAFYMDKPEEVTDLGKEFIAEVFPDYTITYKRYDSVEDIPKKKVDSAKLAKVKAEAIELGVKAQAIDGAKTESVESLIKAKKFEIEQAKKEETPEPVTKPKQPIRRSTK